MTSAHDGDNSPGTPGGRTAAGATPLGTAAGNAPSGLHEADRAAPSGLHEVGEAVHELEAEAEHRPPPAGPVTNTLVALLVVALGVAALLGSLSLGSGSPASPGSGTWPLIISVTLIVLGLALLPAARRTADAERFGPSSLQVLAGLATMAVFAVLIPVIGFEIPAALLAFVWLRFLGGESWRSSIITTIGVVVAFYLIFVAALAVPIPRLF